MITLVIYSVIVAVFFELKEWAVFGLTAFWLMESFISFETAMSSYRFLGEQRKKNFLTDDLAR